MSLNVNAIATVRRLLATALGLWLILATTAPPSSAAEGVLLDRIVAVVGDGVITASELSERVEEVRRRLRGQSGSLPAAGELRKQVLERLVLERLQLQRAEELGIRIDDLRLNEAMRSLARQNNLSLAEFRERLVAEGIDFAAFRERIRDQLTMQKLRERQVDNRINVTEQEIKDFLASQSGKIDQDVEYRLRHILVSLPEAASPEEIAEARERARDLRQQAVQGGDFRQLAITESDGQNALDGGDLGWREASRLPTPFARSVTLMKVGEVSDLIRSPSGFHIIKLVDRRGGQRAMVEQTRARHILIETNAMVDSADARRKLRELRKRIHSGEDFGKLAKAHSDDKSTAADGGSLGWLSPGETVPKLESVLESLGEGQISEPFQTRYGWHIVQRLERRKQDSTRQTMRAEAREVIRRRKREEELELWLRRLRAEAFVELRLNEAPSKG